MDLEALPLSHSFPALDFWIAESTEKDVFDGWFKTMELPLPTAKPLLGWTSWYHYFNNISAEIIEQNLESLAQSNLPMQCFQIDDGWQSAVGDWFSVKPAFPGGMTEMARKISEKGYSPGLWLAPFVASAGSELVKKHPDWLLKDERGRALKAGWNPMWGGHYYALDFYNNAVRDYLSGVFHTVLDKWGYQLLKLDFLFAVCLAPPKGKTRGAVMWEAMEFLRRLVGHRQILACGVPLGACIGQVEYCRIGGDIHMAWEHKLLKWLNHRERVSSIASLRSTLGRWQLNGRAFQNDPDVFVLRKNKQQLSPNQQFTILVINALLGNVLLTSDNVADYGPEQYAILEAVPEWRGSQVLAVKKLQEDVYNIAFKHDGTHWAALCNLTKNKVVLADDQELLPYQTVVVAQDNY
jgi:alpha-galactosidase